MYYFVDMYDNKLNFIDSINNEQCKEVIDASFSVQEVLKFYTLGKCFKDAWEELTEWSNKADRSGNNLMRNLHVAERLVRGYLFEFRTCLDHMETEIKREYGENSTLWNLFKSGTADAYDNHPAYAFTFHLRNCSQHCKNVVHGFNCTTGIGISSNTHKLLAEYSKWKQVDKDYMTACGNEIDLLKTFSETFSAFNDALAPLISHLLNTKNIGKQLQCLREWGDLLHKGFKHDVHCYNIVNILFADGSDATKEDMAPGKVIINAYPLDWEIIYELSSSVVVTQ